MGGGGGEGAVYIWSGVEGGEWEVAREWNIEPSPSPGSHEYESAS